MSFTLYLGDEEIASGGGGSDVTLDADGTLTVDGLTVELATDAAVAAGDAASVVTAAADATAKVLVETNARVADVDSEETARIAADDAHVVASDPHGDRAYAAALFAANDALLYKGAIDCSGNPNYPAADAGHVYRVSVAGKIGGASGPNVEINDTLMCFVDGSSAGTHAAVGGNWDIFQSNLDGAVIGPASAVDGGLALFNGTTGKIVKADGLTPSNDDILQRKASAWVNRTIAQLLVDLAAPGTTFQPLNADLTDLVARWVAASAAGPASLDFLEDTDNGSNKATVQAAASLASDVVITLPSATGTLVNTDQVFAQAQAVNAQTGTTYTLVAADAGKLVTLSNASAITLTLPQDSDATIAVGTYVDLYQLGAGQVTVAAGTGATLRTSGLTAKARAQYSRLGVQKVSASTWSLFGDLAAS